MTNSIFHAFTASWAGPNGEWSLWIAARTDQEALLCAKVTFAVLEAAMERRSHPTA